MSDVLVYITREKMAIMQLLSVEIAVIRSTKKKENFFSDTQHPNRWEEDREDAGKCQLSNAAPLNLYLMGCHP